MHLKGRTLLPRRRRSRKRESLRRALSRRRWRLGQGPHWWQCSARVIEEGGGEGGVSKDSRPDAFKRLISPHLQKSARRAARCGWRCKQRLCPLKCRSEKVSPDRAAQGCKPEGHEGHI
jgi:hypothetical protein